MLLYANHYYNFGFNITHISSVKNSYHKEGETVLKSPSHPWEKFIRDRQRIDELHSLNWNQSVGLGAALGYNNLRALDIDGCNDINIVHEFLNYLNFPLDYQWVTKSGSNNGFHIIFYAPNHRYRTDVGKVKVFAPNRKYKNKFQHIELRWFGNLVLPPSKHPSGNNYEFLNTDMPTTTPHSLNIEDLEYFIINFCSNDKVSFELTSGVYCDGEGFIINPEEPIFKYHDGKEEYNFMDWVDIDLFRRKSPYYFFFDTETTGSPINWKASVTDLENWPRIVQIAFVICNEFGEEIEQAEYIIKPENFNIPKSASDIHGITTKIAKNEGYDLSIVLTNINSRIYKSKYVIAHNIDFDKNVIGAELLRCSMENFIPNKRMICTMDQSTNYCAIKSANGYKWPKLSELYFKLFNTRFEGEHTAMSDVKATLKCFFELKRIGVV